MDKGLLYIFILSLFLLNISKGAFSQQTLDSLERKIHDSENIREEVKNMLKYAEKLKRGNPDSALTVINSAEKVARENDYKKGIALSKKELGDYFRAISNRDKTLEAYTEAAEYAGKHGFQDIKGESDMMKGFIYERMRKHEKAIPLYLSAQKTFRETGNNKLLGRSLWMLGNTYLQDKELNKALEIFQEGKSKFELASDSVGIYDCITNMSIVYIYLPDFEKALSLLEKSEKYYRSINQTSALSASLNNQAHIYGEIGEYQKAIEKSLEAYELKKRFSSKRGVAISENIIATIYSKLNDIENSNSFHRKALENAKTAEASDLIKKSYKGLYENYKSRGDYKTALEYKELLGMVKDSIYNLEKSNQIAGMRTKYETEKKEQQIELLEKKEDLQAKELEKKKMTIYFSVTGLILLLSLAGLLFKSNRQQKKANEIISKQKEKVQNQKEVVDEKNREITDSINYAKRIQDAILPSSTTLRQGLKNGFVLFLPKDVVSGDFYWLEKHKGRIFIAAADCTGHGVPGAMVSVICSNALSKALLEEGYSDPGKLLDRTRELVMERFEKSEQEVNDGMDISLCAIPENPANQTEIHWAGANNPLWIIRNNKNETEEVKPDKQPIGKYYKEMPFTTHKVTINKGDSIYMFSDGYADQFGGEKGKKFKKGNFKKLLTEIQDKPFNKQKEILNQTFTSWKGNLEQVDDVCVIGMGF